MLAGCASIPHHAFLYRLQAAARDGEVAQQLAMLALQAGTVQLPVAARLLADCHDRRLVSLSGGAADTCQLLLHVDHLAEAYLGGGGTGPVPCQGLHAPAGRPIPCDRARGPALGPSDGGQGPPVVPLLLRHFDGGQEEWVLIGQVGDFLMPWEATC